MARKAVAGAEKKDAWRLMGSWKVTGKQDNSNNHKALVAKIGNTEHF